MNHDDLIAMCAYRVLDNKKNGRVIGPDELAWALAIVEKRVSRKSMNSLTITGNLGKDAELRALNNGDPVLTFSVADSQGKDKPAIWWNCSLFGKRAESLAPYLVKGQQVTVVGNVTERAYTDKNGQERKAMDVRVHDLALQGGKSEAKPEPKAAPKQSLAEMDSDVPF